MNALTRAKDSILELADTLRLAQQARMAFAARRSITLPPSATQEIAGHTVTEVIDLAKRQGITDWPLRASRQGGLWVHVYPAQGAA